MVAFTSGKAILAVLLSICTAVLAQDPFISYNTSIPIGQAGFVRWDTNTFSGPVNLFLQQLAPNASEPQVPLDYSNTKGFFLWSAGTNLVPGQYFYQLQKVGGTGIIYKSNPIMVICSECAVSSQPPPNTATDAPTGGNPTPTATGQTNTSGGSKLSAGAAAGIGVGGSLALVAIIGLIFFLFRRSRKRKQAQYSQAPGGMSQNKQYPASITPGSPAPTHFTTAYNHPIESKSGFPPPSPANLNAPMSPHRHPSHELDSNHGSTTPYQGGYPNQSQSGGNMTPRHMGSPAPNIVAPQPQSPHNDQYQYQHPQGQVSPPIGGGSAPSNRTPGSFHETNSYGFPAPSDRSPGSDEAYGHGRQHSATSPGSHQNYPRRGVGSPR